MTSAPSAYDMPDLLARLEALLVDQGFAGAFQLEATTKQHLRPERHLLAIKAVVLQSALRPLDFEARMALETELESLPPENSIVRASHVGPDGVEREILVRGLDVRTRIGIVNDEAGMPDEQPYLEMFVVGNDHPTAPLDALLGINATSNPDDLNGHLDGYLEESVFAAFVKDAIWNRARWRPGGLAHGPDRAAYLRSVGSAFSPSDALRAAAWIAACEFAMILGRYHAEFDARSQWASGHGYAFYPEDGSSPFGLPEGGPPHPEQPRTALAGLCVSTVAEFHRLGGAAAAQWDMQSVNTMRVLKDMAFGLLGGCEMNLIRFRSMTRKTAEKGRRLQDFTSWPL